MHPVVTITQAHIFPHFAGWEATIDFRLDGKGYEVRYQCEDVCAVSEWLFESIAFLSLGLRPRKIKLQPELEEKLEAAPAATGPSRPLHRS